MLRFNQLFNLLLVGFVATALVFIIYGLCMTLLLRDNLRSPTSLRHLYTAESTLSTNTLTTTTVKILDEQSIVEKIESVNQNLPLSFWKSKSKTSPITRINSTCALFPNIYEIEFSNNHWQTLNTPNGIFYLFGAYFDDRPLNRLGRTVRVLVMHNRIEPTVNTFCQFWYHNSSEPDIVPVVEYKYIWNKKWGNYRNDVFQPYLMACQLLSKRNNNQVPNAISIVARKCDKSTNLLKVINNRPLDGATKQNFAVCVKGLDFLDVKNETALSYKLIEWLEVLRLLGAHHVYMYELQVNSRLKELLNYYQNEEKFVTVSSLTLPGGLPNSPYLQHMYLANKINSKRQNEIIPYNDCFYRNIYLYRYIVLLDIDEIIMPKIADNWHQLLDDRIIPKLLKDKNNSKQLLPQSFNARNVYFLDDLLHTSHGWFDDIPKYAHMLQHVYRTKNYTKRLQYVKCFHDTEQVVALHNHFPLACFGRVCKSHEINISEGHLQHYRADCVRTLKNACTEMRKESVQDTTIWKLKEQLIKRLSVVVKLLNLL